MANLKIFTRLKKTYQKLEFSKNFNLIAKGHKCKLQKVFKKYRNQ